ncbi:SusD-like starch-binding protein associating with outer membrane [Chitinophaga niastensis]|uniref:SusD-like starch-binding protein associating with outer membrane n=1 Tax=Chitinophaga niastensis TaxID=536980 RepID=A0A2P8HN41_CHINA|nr:SusD/RagB family nutrient-binding outer membrane lipoprotein [Chitinophaga niastensis]PSL47626.1 SusD-like starch-binding protein associating with outer membrane [Chitinophaga niastensis]
MKSISRYIMLLAVPAASLLTSCTKNFPELNKDTNKVSPENNIPIYNLTRAELEYTGNHDFSFETWRVNIIYCSLMTQQLASTVGWYSGDKYSANNGFASSYFTMAYGNQIKYIDNMLDNTKGKPNYANLYQVGRIARVLIYQRLTDLYGAVPYFEAGTGVSSTPAYDQQQVIYADMLKELDEAAKALDNTKDQIGASDLVYRGGTDAVNSWKKLAYSLMVRLGMRLSKVSAKDAQTWVEKGAAGGTFASNDDNAYIIGDPSGGRNTINRNSNILSGEWDAVGKGNVYLGKTMVDFLQSNNDPRLQYLAQISSTGDKTPSKQIGMPNGYDENNAANDIKTAPGFPGAITNYSTIQKNIWLKTDGPTFLVTYPQTELLLAEAAQKGWNVGASAGTHYANGVSGAMKQLAQYDKSAVVSDADVATYLTAHPYAPATALEQINTQYWAACFLDWYEAWSNWRRTDFPKLKPVVYPGDNNGGQIPRRMLYPTTEASANGASYEKAIADQGVNTFTTRVWWDK